MRCVNELSIKVLKSCFSECPASSSTSLDRRSKGGVTLSPNPKQNER